MARMTPSPELWHYTCRHTVDKLGEGGTLVPPLWQLDGPPPGMPRAALALLGLVWATELDEPRAAALGLAGRTLITCDRTERRYRVPRAAFVRWGRMRGRLPVELVDALELAEGAEPSQWWTSAGPVVGARLDVGWGPV